MNRQETVLLLKEIIVICGSFYGARAVSIQNDWIGDSWELHVYWVPNPSETECIKKIIVQHFLEMITINGRSIFRSKKKFNLYFKIVLAFLACMTFYVERLIFE
jgi:hypothetical protein